MAFRDDAPDSLWESSPYIGADDKRPVPRFTQEGCLLFGEQYILSEISPWHQKRVTCVNEGV